jgi:hypothetical protein
MVIEKIQTHLEFFTQNIVIMRFNPWLCTDQKQLISQFFKQLSTTVAQRYPAMKNICGYMNDYAEEIELAGDLPHIGGLLRLLAKHRARRATEKNNNLQGIKTSIEENLRKDELRLIITIDDIDRLSNDEIATVFQLVKSLADFPYTTYLLSFDHEIVCRALQDIHDCDGAKYLEKIIQSPFPLPYANSDDIHKIFFDKLENIIGNVPDNKWDKYYWNDLFYFGIKPYLSTIRHVNRFINAFSLKFEMIKNEVSLIDFIGVTCIQVFEPTAYSMLPTYKKFLCSFLHGYLDFRTNDENEKKVKFIWDIISKNSNNIEGLRGILCCLFPKVGWTIGKNPDIDLFIPSRHINVTVQELLFTNSIAHNDCFSRYFSLSLESDAISNSHLEKIIMLDDEDAMIGEISTLNQNKKSARLLNHIRATFCSTASFPEERVALVFRCLCKTFHMLEDELGDRTFLAISLEYSFYSCANALLQKLNETSRITVLSEVFVDSCVSLSTIAVLLVELERELDRFGLKNSNAIIPSVTEESMLKLEPLFIQRTQTELDSGALISNFSWQIIFLFENINDKLAKVTIANMLVADLGLVNFINAHFSIGKRGDRETTRIYKLNIAGMEKYSVVDDVYSRMSNFIFTDEFMIISRRTMLVIVAFILIVEKINNKDSQTDSRLEIFEPLVKTKLIEIEELNRKEVKK